MDYQASQQKGRVGGRARTVRISQEVSSLATSLPVQPDSSIFLRVDEDRFDVMRAMIRGPKDTPYEVGWALRSASRCGVWRVCSKGLGSINPGLTLAVLKKMTEKKSLTLIPSTSRRTDQIDQIGHDLDQIDQIDKIDHDLDQTDQIDHDLDHLDRNLPL